MEIDELLSRLVDSNRAFSRSASTDARGRLLHRARPGDARLEIGPWRLGPRLQPPRLDSPLLKVLEFLV
ncbi:hypothetical protein B296_00000512 [Ensete ventricosum]|uniref:Uncharacterized protein n=1 Tax=Ensete ventricosum TaxID=4639 RepID=A0A427AUM0_ENSVE|nr:hypothetical protein B296_00000512 [Ensete ventricosum]